jgi:hypothetical protein
MRCWHVLVTWRPPGSSWCDTFGSHPQYSRPWRLFPCSSSWVLVWQPLTSSTSGKTRWSLLPALRWRYKLGVPTFGGCLRQPSLGEEGSPPTVAPRRWGSTPMSWTCGLWWALYRKRHPRELGLSRSFIHSYFTLSYEVHHFVYPRQWEIVSWTSLVKVSKICAHPPLAILFLNHYNIR